MNETQKKFGEKRLIQLSKEQEERMAAQSVQKIQAFIGEASQVQGRRCEVLVAVVVAAVTRGDAIENVNVEACRKLANEVVAADSRQKWMDLKALFIELSIKGPQPHLEWAAKQVGVTLFDDSPEEAQLIQPATTHDVIKALQ